ncbi:MAG TPA: dTDP-glucose 4,6-dehydratase [Bacteroidales bacterium]|nr:dTDP-glucose 4,6-dehydratase [Bacteroidales bacterium]HPT11717.1 dTDP-glucose 4,6-dehydratase [Bacteroidales bacterium]
MKKNILITGGAGFIGSHVVRRFVRNYPDYTIVNADKLTYAGNLENLADIKNEPNYNFRKADIIDKSAVLSLLDEFRFDGIIHLAAESHVDRSITSPDEFILTNIVGTVNLLNAFRSSEPGPTGKKLFYHISTDEVYGSLGRSGLFTEETPYDPKSPYSASKASSDHMVRAFGNTFGLPWVISNCSNNYGPNQFPEKLIPLTINNIKNNKEIPVYGKGDNVRDWLYVEDHAAAIDLIFHKGIPGETYNIGGDNEWKNIDIVRLLCTILDEKLGREAGSSQKLITFVPDRLGHDKRYAIDSSKLKKELGWRPSLSFKEGIVKTVEWYLENSKWLERIVSGEYTKYYEKQYHRR